MIIVRLNGGLGNQMYQYAFGRSLAFQLNTEFCIDDRYLLNRTPRKGFVFRDFNLSIFNIQARFFKQGTTVTAFKVYGDKFFRLVLPQIRKYFPWFCKKLYLETRFAYDAQYLQNGTDLYCIGYFQSFKYFEPIAHLLACEFSIKTPIIDISKPLLQNIQQTNSVCLHVRRGDYVNHPLHGTLALEYYHKAIEKLQTLVDAPLTIFVFSDDINWCRINLKLHIAPIFVPDEFAGELSSNHFQLMLNCKHFIISNSTFAWWAAYLAKAAGKKIIAPATWVLNTQFTAADILPSSWIVI